MAWALRWRSQPTPASSMSQKFFMSTALRKCLPSSGLAFALWLGCAAARAQEVPGDPLVDARGVNTAFTADRASGQGLANPFPGWRSLASIDLGAMGIGGRHGALRFRFDSATQAMRHMGVAADGCATLLRSNRRAGPDGSSHPGLSVALNCRFF